MKKKNYEIDFLINNAGFGGFGAFEEYTLAYVEKMIDLNIKATTRMTHYFIPELKKNSPSFDTKIFKKIEGFDKNIFLYYEENDYFHKCNILKYKLYLVTNSYFYHSQKGDSSSAIFSNKKEKDYAKLIGGWHGQWSKFYYLKNQVLLYN